MKKITVKGKLNLNKEVVKSLTEAELSKMKGGWYSFNYRCSRQEQCSRHCNTV